MGGGWCEAVGKIPLPEICSRIALETVIEGETGVFFDVQTPEALSDAVKRFEEAFLVQVTSSSASSGSGSLVQGGISSASYGDELFNKPKAPVLELELATSTRQSCRANAERFRPERFRAEIKAFLTKHYPELFEGYVWPQGV